VLKLPRHEAYDGTLAVRWAGAYRSSRQRNTLYIYIYRERERERERGRERERERERHPNVFVLPKLTVH
jgi:hypothetical protein